MEDDPFYGYILFVNDDKILDHARWFGGESGYGNFTVGDIRSFRTLGPDEWLIENIVCKGNVFGTNSLYEVHLKPWRL